MKSLEVPLSAGPVHTSVRAAYALVGASLPRVGVSVAALKGFWAWDLGALFLGYSQIFVQSRFQTARRLCRCLGPARACGRRDGMSGWARVGR